MIKDIYEANISALKGRFSDVSDLLEKKDTYAKDIQAEVMNLDGDRRLVALKDNKYVQLESLYNNEKVSQIVFKDVDEDWDLDSKFYMFGLGNGQLVRYYLEHTSTDHKIFVIEPSVNIFKTVIENYDLVDLFLNDRFIFTVIDGIDENKYLSYFDSVMSYTDIYTLKTFIHHNYDYLFNKECSIWRKYILNVIDKLEAEHILYEVHGLDFVKNNLCSFKYVSESKSIIDLKDNMPEGVPSIIVAGGPSLKKNINQIKHAKGKALIIAVDAAINPLIKAGIYPDIIVCVDPSKGAEYISAEGADTLPLVCGMNVGREFTENHKGIKFYVAEANDYIDNFFETNGITLQRIALYGTVSALAFSLGIFLKSKEVILVGQDLAYTNDESHVQGSVRGKETMDDLISEKFEIDEDIYGNPIKTSKMFVSFKYWFEKQIRNNDDVRVIDATEGGIKIVGSEILTLQESILKYCDKEFDFQKVLNKTGNLLTEEQSDKFNKYVDELPIRLDEIKILIESGLEKYKEIEIKSKQRTLDVELIKNTIREANNILDKIEKDKCTIYLRFITQKYTNEMLRAINVVKKDIRDELQMISNVGIEYMSALIDAIDELKTEINMVR